MNIEDQVYKNLRNTDKHQKQYKKVIMLGRKLMRHLGSDSLIFLEYETSVGLLHNIYLRKAYNTGLEEGKRLAQINESCPTKCLTKT